MPDADIHVLEIARPKRKRPSRAKPRPPRATELILAELRGLGGVVLEHGLLGPASQPVSSLVAWQRRLTEELGFAGAPRATTYHEMMHQIVAINRRANAPSMERLAA